MSDATRVRRAAEPKNGKHLLVLYVAGATPTSIAAFRNLERLCEEHLPGLYMIEVVDLVKHPRLARTDQILAVPTVVRRLPPPIRRIIGNLTDAQRVLIGLDLRPERANPFTARKKTKNV